MKKLTVFFIIIYAAIFLISSLEVQVYSSENQFDLDVEQFDKNAARQEEAQLNTLDDGSYLIFSHENSQKYRDYQISLQVLQQTLHNQLFLIDYHEIENSTVNKIFQEEPKSAAKEYQKVENKRWSNFPFLLVIIVLIAVAVLGIIILEHRESEDF